MSASPYIVKKRDGDWICSVCHNLNFSFRNQCNRCLKYPRRKRITSKYDGFRTLVLLHYNELVDITFDDDNTNPIDPAVQVSLLLLDLV